MSRTGAAAWPSEARCRAVVRARSGGRCEACGNRPAQGMHHREKRSRGGLWIPCNVLDLCGSGTTGCHGWIEHHPLDAEPLGWHLGLSLDPDATPAWLSLIGWRGWFMLGHPEPELAAWVDAPTPDLPESYTRLTYA